MNRAFIIYNTSQLTVTCFPSVVLQNAARNTFISCWHYHLVSTCTPAKVYTYSALSVISLCTNLPMNLYSVVTRCQNHYLTLPSDEDVLCIGPAGSYRYGSKVVSENFTTWSNDSLLPLSEESIDLPELSPFLSISHAMQSLTLFPK